MSKVQALTITGNLTDEPELRYTPSGVALANFTVAVNNRRKNGDDWEDDPAFVRCVAWGDLGERVAESLSKGDRVLVYGEIKQSRWQTEDGQNRSMLQVTAHDVGASMRFATVSVTRVGRSTASPAQRGGNDWDYGPDEAPF